MYKSGLGVAVQSSLSVQRWGWDGGESSSAAGTTKALSALLCSEMIVTGLPVREWSRNKCKGCGSWGRLPGLCSSHCGVQTHSHGMLLSPVRAAPSAAHDPAQDSVPAAFAAQSRLYPSPACCDIDSHSKYRTPRCRSATAVPQSW
ncbi:hypothetical protein NDU88_004147 [Pleurodeles waltl]|uniref:Uncharacterized protein n=1 Tax=Pleurodeles waltl TaxID=8319 RepID=A0AAV7V283_PLEWA|nr:hypothetical protein NDU88_004147 [Pleurodeles waltl]